MSVNWLSHMESQQLLMVSAFKYLIIKGLYSILYVATSLSFFASEKAKGYKICALLYILELLVGSWLPNGFRKIQNMKLEVLSCTPAKDF